MNTPELRVEDVVADVGILVALAGLIIFVVSYVAFFNWRRTQAGRALMYFVISLLVVAAIAALGRWIGPEYPLRWLLRPTVWWFVAFTVLRLVWVLWSNWRRRQPRIDIETKPRKDSSFS